MVDEGSSILRRTLDSYPPILHFLPHQDRDRPSHICLPPPTYFLFTITPKIALRFRHSFQATEVRLALLCLSPPERSAVFVLVQCFTMPTLISSTCRLFKEDSAHLTSSSDN
jgi:hypothetical protein